MTTFATRARRLRTAIGAMLAAITSMALTASAFAQSSSVDGYNGAGGDAASTVNQTTDSSSSLPFTGLDLWMLGGAGLGLVAIGLGMRWLSGRSPSTPTGV